jgi:hypothetical protein
MSYYIAKQSDNLMLGDVVIYRVVKRLSDFKPEDGQLYRVFKSKKEKDESPFVPVYMGMNGKLKKQPSEWMIRF